MKDIKIFFGIFLIIISLFGCTKHEQDFSENYNFVRFGLILNANNIPLEFPQVRADFQEVDLYKTDRISDIKIPIVMSTLLQNSPTDIFYSVSTTGDFSDFTVSPINKITLPAGRLTDTIRIRFNSRWITPDANQIKFKITSTSNPDLKIGWNNANKKLDELTIVLGNLDVRKYSFRQNLYSIVGQANEEVLIPIQFSQPVSNASIGSFNFINAQFSAISLCNASNNNFQFTLTREPFVDGATVVNYKLKLLQNLTQASNLILTLNSGLANYQTAGLTTTAIRFDSNASLGNPAGNWYSTTDPLYRTFGKAWYFNTTDNLCRWQNFFAFTKPVAVPANSLYNNGQGFHRLKIGFVSNNLPIGTNPFDFVRFYNGASVESPAFTIPEAIEFFPSNGNSTTNGTVKIIPQVLTFIRLSNDSAVQVPICGSGTYNFNPIINRWEMFLEIRCDETAINGNNNVVRSMYLYSNNNNNANPANLTTSCSNRINL